ncbi:MAG: MaoC/PaaZ C-terminal domain-containing protein [Actinomycetota bacterium]|jgi:acyl dehydratase
MSAAARKIEAGTQLPEREVGPFTRLDFVRFSVATDDPNRVHIEEAVAAEAGLPGVIGSGGIVGGLLTDIVSSWAGLESLRSASLRVLAPLFPGAVLRAGGEVVGLADDGSGLVEVLAQVHDALGTRVGEGTFRVQLESEDRQ